MAGVKAELYSREQCPLCDQAYELLLQAGVEVALIDISGRVDLLQRYARRIPVLRTPEGQELDWPFGADEVRELF